mgnify:CR=1 FL=1
MGNKKSASFKDAVKFHGHSCPGLAVGYRVATIALRELSSGRADDEEFVAVVENGACGIDAIQIICGCTAGKGNLIIRDRGKNVYTFYNRKTGKGVRIYAEPYYKDDDDDKRFIELAKKDVLTDSERKEKSEIKERRIKRILTDPEEKYIKLGRPVGKMPGTARIFVSGRCDICGEKTAEPYLKKKDGKTVCPACSNELPGGEE